MTGNALTLRIGGAVRIGGLDIQPGDLLHGDASGVLTVPAERTDEILEKAAANAAWESHVLDFMLGAPFTVDELMKQFH